MYKGARNYFEKVLKPTPILIENLPKNQLNIFYKNGNNDFDNIRPRSPLGFGEQPISQKYVLYMYILIINKSCLCFIETT